MTDIATLQQTAVTFRDERNWKQFHHFKEMLLSLGLEVSEFSELFQWKTDEEIRDLSTTDLQEQLGDELSDILYWILLFAEDLNINLDSAFHQKMAKNRKKYPIETAKNSRKKYSAQ
ncbi:nucleotide pyrophosphohydrolase [bacterium]|nr:nucleotide pyrophosphohydrolase [bacterium]